MFLHRRDSKYGDDDRVKFRFSESRFRGIRDIVIRNVSGERNVEKIRESAELGTEKPVLRAMRNYDSNTRATNTRPSLRLTAVDRLSKREFDRSAGTTFFPLFLPFSSPSVTRSEEGLVTK